MSQKLYQMPAEMKLIMALGENTDVRVIAIVNHTHNTGFSNLSGQECHAGPVHPSVVSSGGHGLQVVLTLTGGDVGTSQLAVVHLDSVSLHSLLHLH